MLSHQQNRRLSPIEPVSQSAFRSSRTQPPRATKSMQTVGVDLYIRPYRLTLPQSLTP